MAFRWRADGGPILCAGWVTSPLLISAMAVGNAALITTMIEEERASSKIYLQKLTDKMEANHVS